MSTLIIGGTGFIGARLAERFVKGGDKVICFDLYPNYEKVAHMGNNVEVVVGDVTRIEDVLGVIQKFGVERIINLAAMLVAESEAFLSRALRLNLFGMVNIFEAAKILGIKRVVYASSIAVYGLQSSFGERAITEDDICQPVLAYGAEKLWAEFMAKKYMEKHDLSTVGLRIAMVSGPGRKTGISAWSSTYVDNPVLGKPVEIPYRQDQKVLITYVDETAETFYRLSLADSLNHPVYNSLSRSVSIKELVDVVRGTIPEVRVSFNDKAGDMPLVYNWSSERLENELHLKSPTVGEMIAKHISEVRAKAGR